MASRRFFDVLGSVGDGAWLACEAIAIVGINCHIVGWWGMSVCRGYSSVGVFFRDHHCGSRILSLALFSEGLHTARITKLVRSFVEI
jgi:hypothetical protein